MSVSLSAFIERWRTASDRERARGDVFLRELCLALDLPLPSRAAAEAEPYVLSRRVRVPRPDGSEAWEMADLYREGRFVLEMAAPGSGLNGMERARARAFEVAENLPARPPFVVVCEAGRCFDLYASFDGRARYRAFPGGEAKRLAFEDLERHAGTLRAVWMDPMALEPTRRAARVTGEAVASVAVIAEELRAGGHPGPRVAAFVLACIRTMVLEDAGQIGRGSWSGMLEDHWIPEPASFPGEVEALWRGMAGGGGARQGEPATKALPLTEGQLRRLLQATRHPWSQVDPVVAGALIEHAIHPDGRGASLVPETPRAHVERLVRPTIEDPLRVEWSMVRAEAWVHLEREQPDAARRAISDFQRRLTGVRVLDPACGGGAFLCAALDVLGEIEGEAVAELRALGETEAPPARVGPAQMLGIDVDPWAVQIAEHMLWLDQLARRRRAQGPEALERYPKRPVHGVERRDALLAWDATEPVRDGKGAPVTRWDDEEKKAVEVRQYLRPRPAEWPRAKFIVGNVPFMGGRRVRSAIGEGYFAALRAAYPEVPADADLAMYWLDRAARLARRGEITRFGFALPAAVGTQQMLSRHVDVPDEPLQIVFAAPEHRWEGAEAVHMAMVVGQRNAVTTAAELGTVEGPGPESFSSRLVPRIGSSLRPGASVLAARPLAANAGLCSAGVQLGGKRFVLPEDVSLEGGGALNPETSMPVVRPYVRGRDLVGRATHERVIDFFGLDAGEAAHLAPAAFRRVELLVKPEREAAARGASTRYWRFASDRPGFRAACRGLRRYIATPDIAKHRVFAFVDASVLPDQTLACIAHEDAYILGVLSSRVHVTWAMAAGGIFFGRPRYGKTTCFDPFPFPACTELQRRAIRDCAESLDAHRRRRLAAHPDLTVTGMYNALEKLRAGEALDDAERSVHDRGQVSILRQIHGELDRAVLDAYCWPVDLSDGQVLEKVVALNGERIEEERGGFTRWLRPEIQRSGAVEDDGRGVEPAGPAVGTAPSWPEAVHDQVVAARDLVLASKHAWSAEELCAAFRGARKHQVASVLDALAGVGELSVSEPAEGKRRWGAPRRP